MRKVKVDVGFKPVYIGGFNRRLQSEASFGTTFCVPENIVYRGRCRLRRHGPKIGLSVVGKII